MPPQTAPSSENLIMGAGSVYFDRFDAAGVATGLKHLGNVSTLELTTEDDPVDKYSSMTAGRPLYKRVNRRRTITLRLTGDEFHPENMALGTMGSQATLVQAATPVVAEAVYASTIKGAYFRTKKLGPITAVAVKFGVATGVLNTDYAIINAAVGLIRILPGTAQTGAVTIDYTPTAYTAPSGPQTVSGGVSGIIQGRVTYISDNSTGPNVIIEFWKCSITPDGAIGFIGDDYAEMSLSAAVLDDSAAHPASPLYEIQYLP